MNLASLAIFFILAGLSYLHIVGRDGPALKSQGGCSSYKDAASCYNNGNCGWCLATETNSARCIDNWSNDVSSCGNCTSAPNETTCDGAMNPTPLSESDPWCYWASGRFGKSGCYGSIKQQCALRAVATCSTYPNFECGVCGSHCVPSSGHHSGCPSCSAYTNGSSCSQGLVPGGPSGGFCFRSYTGRCSSCGSAKTVAGCAAFENSDEPCGWCDGHGCVPKADNAQCPNCTALSKVNQTTCTASLNPNYNPWATNPSPKRCLWVDGECGNGGSEGECALATTPSACLSQRYNGFERCGWCGDHCSKSGPKSTAQCPSCSTYANASYCQYSLIPRPGGNNDYCLWDSTSGRCFGSGSAFCKSFTDPKSCSQDGSAENTQCQWCNDALGCTSTDVSKNCTPCSALTGTNRSTCESYWNGDSYHCIWYNGGCFSNHTALCASLTTMAQCYPGPRSGQLCGWCGGKCVKQYSSATASCPNCSSLVSATDCYHSVIPNGQPGGAGLCIWSNSLSRCFGGDSAYCAAFSNNATACAAAGVFPCGMCGKHGCVQPPSFNQPACPKCDTITTADLCKASYIPNSQGPSLLCAWKGGKCVNPNAAP